MEPIMLLALAVVVYGGLVTLGDLSRDLGREGISLRAILAGYWRRGNRYLLNNWDDFCAWVAPPRHTVSLLYVRSNRLGIGRGKPLGR